MDSMSAYVSHFLNIFACIQMIIHTHMFRNCSLLYITDVHCNLGKALQLMKYMFIFVQILCRKYENVFFLIK